MARHVALSHVPLLHLPRRKLVTKGGYLIRGRLGFTDQLPKGIDLDGELYGGRGTFQSTSSVWKSKNAEKTWASLNIKFLVYDMPSSDGTFEQRLRELEMLSKSWNKESVSILMAALRNFP